MKVHIGVDSDSGLIHSVRTTAANVHGFTPAADLLHGEETVVYADAGYQGIEKRDTMQGRGIGFRTAGRPARNGRGGHRRGGRGRGLRSERRMDLSRSRFPRAQAAPCRCGRRHTPSGGLAERLQPGAAADGAPPPPLPTSILASPLYYEDMDLWLRLARRGAPVLWLPRPAVSHRRGTGSSTPSPRRLRLSTVSYLRFLRRQCPTWVFALGYLRLLSLYLLRLPLRPQRSLAVLAGLAAVLTETGLRDRSDY